MGVARYTPLLSFSISFVQTLTKNPTNPPIFLYSKANQIHPHLLRRILLLLVLNLLLLLGGDVRFLRCPVGQIAADHKVLEV